MKTVIIGQIPDNFSTDSHIPIAPFCFIGKEDIVKEWENTEHQDDPFDTSLKLKDADILTSNFTLRKIDEFALIFNKNYGLNFSNKFWKVILYPWLLMLIQSVYEKEIRVKNFIDKYKNENFKIDLIKDNIRWEFSDTLDFVNNGVLDNSFNAWIISRIIEKYSLKNWYINYIDCSKEAVKKNTNKNNLTLLTKRKHLKYKLKSIFLPRYFFVEGFSLVDAFIINILLFIKEKKSNQNIKLLSGKEKCLNNVEFKVDINKIINATIPYSIKEIKSRLKNFDCKKQKSGYKINIGSQSLWFDDNTFKIQLALAIENGEKIIGVQHGGHNYGTAKSFSVGNEIEYKQYKFITWGWEQQEDFKADYVPLPSPFLSKIKKKYKSRKDSIVFVGTRAYLFLYRFDSIPQSIQWLHYRKEKINFLKTLNDEILKKLYYRPYFSNNNGSLEDENYIKNKFPFLKILYGDFQKFLINCSLVILDHPGTTLNICLAANIPTICFWEKESWPLCKQSIPYFDELESNGILFHSANEAAKKINSINENISEWWYNKNVQESREQWAEKYARTNKYWLYYWMKKLWEI